MREGTGGKPAGRVDATNDPKSRQWLLANAAASTTALSLVDNHLPVGLLTLVMRSYLNYFRMVTGASAIELYATEVQEAALDRLGGRSRLVAYHVPWQKQVRNLARLVARPHRRPITATVHAYEWVEHIHSTETGRWLSETPGALEALVVQTEPTATELAVLDQAAENGITILFETVVDWELYPYLATGGQSREGYLFRRLDYARRLRDAWLARQCNGAEAPVGVVFNPWHLAMEARGPELDLWLRQGRSAGEIRERLYPLLERYFVAAEDMVQRFYVGNSRAWEVRLPKILQRGRFLDPEGIVPELELLRRALRDQPDLAGSITLEASPQSALFSGHLMNGSWGSSRSAVRWSELACLPPSDVRRESGYLLLDQNQRCPGTELD